MNALIDRIYATVERRGSAIGGREQGSTLEPSQDAGDWEPARAFFEERVVKRVDLRGAGQWRGWSYEMDNVSTCVYVYWDFLGFLDIATRRPSTYAFVEHITARFPLDTLYPYTTSSASLAHPWRFCSYIVQARVGATAHTNLHTASRRGFVRIMLCRGRFVLRIAM